MALLSFRWSERYEYPSPATTPNLHSRDLSSRILTSKCLPGPLLWKQTRLPCGPPRERCYLAMAPPTHMGLRPLPAPPQPFAEPGEFLEVQLPDDAPPDSEYVLKPPTDAPSLRNLKPSQLWPQPSVVRGIRIPNLSTEPRTLKRHKHFCQVKPLSSNQKRSHRQVSLLLSVLYHPLMLVTLHPSR